MKKTFLSAMLLLSVLSPAFCITWAGTSIESAAELAYDAGVITSETVVTTVEQMYGITIEPTVLYGRNTPWNTHYFPHTITNLGNGSDLVTFYFKVATPESWYFALINDNDNDGIHDDGENNALSNPLPISEEGAKNFFVAITAPTTEVVGATGEARLVGTSEVQDGGTYYGANGIIYGGPDTAEVTDRLSIEAPPRAMIYRDDATNKIYLTWPGGSFDIYYIDSTFDATFTNPTTEAKSKTPPYMTTLEVNDGKTRYYKVAPAGTTSFLPQILGKFSVPVGVGLSELSSPLLPNDNKPSTLVGRQVTGGSSSSTADRLWKFRTIVPGSYEVLWLGTNAKWYLGSAVATTEVGTDEAFKLEIRPGRTTTKISFVGEVCSTLRTIEVAPGMNFVGSCYPVKVSLEATNLWQSGMTGGSSSSTGDRLWKFNVSVPGSYEVVWLGTNGKWYIGSKVSTLEVVPGGGFWLEVRPPRSGFTWRYKKPY